MKISGRMLPNLYPKLCLYFEFKIYLKQIHNSFNTFTFTKALTDISRS